MGFFLTDGDISWRRIAIIALCVSVVVAAIVWIVSLFIDDDHVWENAFKWGIYCFFIVSLLLVAYSVVSYIVLGLLSTL